jgi:EAL domain-containing protein (putative c-di-GMP-specific phosphodiesterase class I)
MNRFMIEKGDIVRALERDEFTLYYQPKASLIGGRISGAEALIRWAGPDGRFIPPDQFIPVAEQYGIIKEVTAAVFRKLLADHAVIAEAADLTLSFNASAMDFADGAFARTVLHSVETHQIRPSALQIEITETATLQGGVGMKRNVIPLAEAGIGLAMDDFGKGYSSIDTLSLWPFTTIKLDQGIIGRMLDSPKNATIVEASIRMAHELGIAVVAEGVETNDQYYRLLRSGCTAIQGFLISPPLPLNAFLSLVRDQLRLAGLPVGLIHMAVLDHVQWRRQLVGEVIRMAALAPDAADRRAMLVPSLSPHDCRLGQWYYGLGRLFGDRPAFQALEAPHQKLHHIGAEIIDKVIGGAGMDDIADLLRALSVCSMETLEHLHALEIEGLVEMQAHLE